MCLTCAAPDHRLGTRVCGAICCLGLTLISFQKPLGLALVLRGFSTKTGPLPPQVSNCSLVGEFLLHLLLLVSAKAFSPLQREDSIAG